MNDKRFLTKQIKKELAYKAVSLGDKNFQVRRIQEWLNHFGLYIVIDNDWGPATNRALANFCKANNLDFTDYLTAPIWSALTEPLSKAINYTAPRFNNFSEWVRVATELWSEARELGGNNKGPWVRIFMKGNEGRDWPWCAGFVGTVLEQATQFSGIESPITPSPSSSAMAREAKREGILWAPDVIPNKQDAAYIFVLKGGRTGYKHTGIAFDLMGETFSTVEGNTNIGGSADGDRILHRIRASAKSDLIVLH